MGSDHNRDGYLRLYCGKELNTWFVRSPFFVIHESAWVNIAALAEVRQLQKVRPHRCVADAFCTEFPGGVIDQGEAPARAAQRVYGDMTYVHTDLDYDPGRPISDGERSGRRCRAL